MTVRQPPTGPEWSSLAGLDPLAAVLDPGDTAGVKNALIDRVHRRAVLRAAGSLRGRKLLDFGSGTGRLTRFAAEHGAASIGVDATAEMVDAARKLNPSLQFEHIDGGALPFADATFDIVLSAYVLQYYVGGRGLDEIVSEFARILRPGGRVIAVEQVARSLDRGAGEAAYTAELGKDPFFGITARPIRFGSSRVIGMAQRRPLIGSLPLLPRIVTWEAQRIYRRPLPAGTYLDMLFLARRQ